jgi:hypothetical protein
LGRGWHGIGDCRHLCVQPGQGLNSAGLASKSLKKGIYGRARSKVKCNTPKTNPVRCGHET